MNLLQQPFEARKGSHLRVREGFDFPHPEVPRFGGLEGLVVKNDELHTAKQKSPASQPGFLIDQCCLKYKIIGIQLRQMHTCEGDAVGSTVHTQH